MPVSTMAFVDIEILRSTVFDQLIHARECVLIRKGRLRTLTLSRSSFHTTPAFKTLIGSCMDFLTGGKVSDLLMHINEPSLPEAF